MRPLAPLALLGFRGSIGSILPSPRGYIASRSLYIQEREGSGSSKKAQISVPPVGVGSLERSATRLKKIETIFSYFHYPVLDSLL